MADKGGFKFPEGNTYSTKLKDKETKLKVYKSYCEHIASGKTQKSWKYMDGYLCVSWMTMERYIKEDPDLDPIHKELARSDGLLKWEEICEKSSINEIDANTASLQMIMRNKFGWDKRTEVVHVQNTSENTEVDYSDGNEE